MWHSLLFFKSAFKFTEKVILNSSWSFPFLTPNPFPTAPGAHSHTPADTRPLRGEAAAALALSNPWSARIYPVGHQRKCHQTAKGTEGGDPPPSRGEARAAHRRRLQLHEALFGSPLRGHQAAPGEEWVGGVSVYTGSPRPPPTRPRPLSQAFHALLCQQLPQLLATQAQPLGLGLRAVREEVLGAMRPLGQLLGPRTSRPEFRGAGASRGHAVSTTATPRGPGPTPPSPCHPRAGEHLSTRPAGTSTVAGSESGSIGPPAAAARAPPKPRPLRGRDVRAVLAPGAPLPSANPPGFAPSYLPCVPQTPVCTRVPRSAGPSLI